jgi:hypothetical protein
MQTAHQITIRQNSFSRSKMRHPAVTLPKFGVTAIRKKRRLPLCVFVIRASQIDGCGDMPTLQ